MVYKIPFLFIQKGCLTVSATIPPSCLAPLSLPLLSSSPPHLTPPACHLYLCCMCWLTCSPLSLALPAPSLPCLFPTHLFFPLTSYLPAGPRQGGGGGGRLKVWRWRWWAGALWPGPLGEEEEQAGLAGRQAGRPGGGRGKAVGGSG